MLASIGAIHVPPDAHHDALIREARSNGTAVGPLDAATLWLDWNRTHPAPSITRALDCMPPRLLFRLHFWIENPGAGALFRWLLPRLFEVYGIDLTHCCGGGAGWRKYTQILSTDHMLQRLIGVCGPSPGLNCGHAKRHEITFAGDTPLPADAMSTKHSIPPRLYDALIAPLAATIPPNIRHLYLIVHLGSGSQSSRHLTTREFPVAFVDCEHTVTTNFRTVEPTVVVDYDSYSSIMQVVALAARRAGYHPDAVVGTLFDPCCITRTPMTNINRKHRHPSGQPLPSPDGDEAQARDDRGAFHIADLDHRSVRRDALIADSLGRRGPLPSNLPDGDDSSDDNDDDNGAGDGHANNGTDATEDDADLAAADYDVDSTASADSASASDLAVLGNSVAADLVLADTAAAADSNTDSVASADSDADSVASAAAAADFTGLGDTTAADPTAADSAAAAGPSDGDDGSADDVAGAPEEEDDDRSE